MFTTFMILCNSFSVRNIQGLVDIHILQTGNSIINDYLLQSLIDHNMKVHHAHFHRYHKLILATFLSPHLK